LDKVEKGVKDFNLSHYQRIDDKEKDVGNKEILEGLGEGRKLSRIEVFL